MKKIIVQHRSSGQGLIEFALVLPVLLLLILGIIDFGRIIAIYNESSNATREALRYAMVNPPVGDSAAAVEQRCNNIVDAAKRSLLLTNPNDVAVTVSIDNGADPSQPGGQIMGTCPTIAPGLEIMPGWRVRVALSTDVTPLTPVVNNIVTSIPLSYSGARTMYEKGGVYQTPPPGGNLSGHVTIWGYGKVLSTVQTNEARPVDVVNVLDISGSMGDRWRGGSETKIDSAKAALTIFNTMLDPHTLGDRAGLVTYPKTQSVPQYNMACGGTDRTKYIGEVKSLLTSRIDRIVAAIGRTSASGYTPIGDALRRGRETVLGAEHDPAHLPVIVLASDGIVNVRAGASGIDPINGMRTGENDNTHVPCNQPAADEVLYEARVAKENGIVVFTLAIGDDFDPDVLQQAASPGRFIQVVSEDELIAAYQSIREEIAYTAVGETYTFVKAPGRGAWVSLVGSNGQTYNTMANENGDYIFYNVPYGQYTFKAHGTFTGTLYHILTNAVNDPTPIQVSINFQGGSATKDLFVYSGVAAQPTTTPAATGPLPTRRPTTVPGPTPTPLPVQVKVNYPAVDGTVINSLSQTTFEVMAYDPYVGYVNGDGVENTQFQLVDPNGTVILDRTDNAVPYCLFGGSPCVTWRMSGYASVDFYNAPEGTYTIRARAKAPYENWSPWVTRTFVLARLPVHLEVTPADGATLTTLADTASRAIAYDPSSGTADGNGVNRVEFQLYDPSGALIVDRYDTSAPFCLFGGSPCYKWRTFSDSSGYSNVAFKDAPNGVYTLKVRARSSLSGQFTDWMESTFTVDHAPVYVSIVVPAENAVISDVSQTAFAVTAYDPAVGTTSGNGIAAVQLVVEDAAGTVYLNNTDTGTPYCGFGGSPCSTWRKSGYATVNFSQLANGAYTLKVRAQTTGGVWTDWVLRPYTIQK